MHFQHFMIPWVFTNPGVSSIQGILMIEPKMDFVEKVCNETWTLEDGKITVQPPGSIKDGADGDVYHFFSEMLQVWWKGPDFSIPSTD